MSAFTIAIHGGAGTILQSEMTIALQEQYQAGLKEALNAGYTVLEKGGTAVEAVKNATVALEDNILFNAGRGSVFTNSGQHEMDAAIMDGKTLEAGAVAGLRQVRNPIELADRIMRNSGHVFLSGEGALEFAMQQGMKTEPDEYFFSAFRYDQWIKMRDSESYSLDHSSQQTARKKEEKKFGTVGAVACDKHGNIAAATSTGGMTNKRYGRIGDTPLIGCGTYANNHTCAISATGHGELFIRAVAAYDISCLVEYRGLSLLDAMEEVVYHKLVAIGGEGGMIGVDPQGNAFMVFNSEGMYRGMKSSNGNELISIYKD